MRVLAASKTYLWEKFVFGRVPFTLDDTVYITLDDYQIAALGTAVYPGRGTVEGLTYATLGLCGEAGEVAEKVKKALRDDGGHLTAERRAALKKELGDVAWYMAAVADELDATLGEIAEANLDKLASRKERNVLTGDGDDR